MKVHAKRKNIKGLVIGLSLLIVALGVGLIVHTVRENRRWEAKAGTPQPRKTEIVEYGGVRYTPKAQLESFLIMGLDKFSSDEPQEGYLNDRQADFLLVVAADHGAETLQFLQLNRDTMTRIQRLGIGGGAAGSFTGQLALAHTFGSGGSDSCLNTVKAVSGLLNDMKIDHYLAVTMDAVGILNDLVGGVPVQIEEDFSQVDETLVQGTEVLLQGEQALHFVRARGGMEDSSNLARMARQQLYMESFYRQLEACVEADEDFIGKAFLKVSEQIQTDLTVNQLQQLEKTLEGYTMGAPAEITGEAVKGAEFMEFRPNGESVRKAVLELFYEPITE